VYDAVRFFIASMMAAVIMSALASHSSWADYNRWTTSNIRIWFYKPDGFDYSYINFTNSNGCVN
jgi:hypothetical protein